MSWLVWNVLKCPKRHWKGSVICIEMSWKVFDVKRFWMVVKGVLKGLLKGLEKSWKGQKMSWNVRKCTRISERSLNSCRYGMLCVLVNTQTRSKLNKKLLIIMFMLLSLENFSSFSHLLVLAMDSAIVPRLSQPTLSPNHLLPNPLEARPAQITDKVNS